jgi:hypothetical protein
VKPDDLKRLAPTAEKLEKLAAEFGREKAASLLELLRSLKGKKPKLEEGGKLATFTAVSPVRGGGVKDKKVDLREARVRFRRVGQNWFILDD